MKSLAPFDYAIILGYLGLSPLMKHHAGNADTALATETPLVSQTDAR